MTDVLSLAIETLETTVAAQSAALHRLKQERDAQRAAEEARRHAEAEAAADEQFPPGDLIEASAAAIRYRVPADTVRSWCHRKGVGVKRDGRWFVSNRRIRQMKGYE